jgi:hypothetical protein
MFNVIFFSLSGGDEKGYSNNLLHFRDAGNVFILLTAVTLAPGSKFEPKIPSGCVHVLKLSKFSHGNYDVSRRKL